MNTYQCAIQIYQVLIAAAHHRQTLTYEMVGKRIGVASFGLTDHLRHLQDYCTHHKLPPLTGLVVSKNTGKPGAGYGDTNNIDAEREQVFAYEWYKHQPLTEADLRPVTSPGSTK